MTRMNLEVTMHYCDGCGREAVQPKGYDLPSGFYLQVTDIARGDVKVGELYVCSQKCILPAFKRRLEIWEPDKWQNTTERKSE